MTFRSTCYRRLYSRLLNIGHFDLTWFADPAYKARMDLKVQNQWQAEQRNVLCLEQERLTDRKKGKNSRLTQQF